MNLTHILNHFSLTRLLIDAHTHAHVHVNKQNTLTASPLSLFTHKIQVIIIGTYPIIQKKKKLINPEEVIWMPRDWGVLVWMLYICKQTMLSHISKNMPSE